MVEVRISDGLLEGEKIENEYGGWFYSFKGIPYAKPPIGNLRFMAPQPITPWKDVRCAKEMSPECSQYDNFMLHQYLGQEDCLYLNVYTPDLYPSKPLPVMVWIHGGGFACGSGNSDIYGPEFLIKKDVVLVTFNYRLEALGFLCLDTEAVPGNAGMKDQVAVLRWVQKNIQSFGGDPRNVTIFGESSGAASVSFHLISPMTVGLFKRAILQSGASINCWSRCLRPRDRALTLAKRLGCYSENDTEVTNFLQSVPVESLVKIALPITAAENLNTKIELSFAIVNEKQFNNSQRFFYEDESENEMPEIHRNVEVLIGYNEHEGVVALNGGINTKDMFNHANNLGDYFVPKSIAFTANIHDQIEIGNKIKKYYFRNDVISMSNIKQLLKLRSADMFVHGVIKLAKVLAETNNKVFLYKFTCKSKRNIFTEKYGAKSILGDEIFVSHADDLAYLFPLSAITPKVDQNSIEYKMINVMTELWTNFARCGFPTPNNKSLGVEWLPFTTDRQDYLNIGNNLNCEKFPEEDEIIFWDKIYHKYLPNYGRQAF